MEMPPEVFQRVGDVRYMFFVIRIPWRRGGDKVGREGSND